MEVKKLNTMRVVMDRMYYVDIVPSEDFPGCSDFYLIKKGVLVFFICSDLKQETNRKQLT